MKLKLSPQQVELLQATSALAHLLAKPQTDEIKATAQQAIAVFMNGLPKKADGSDWTPDDIHLAAAAANAAFQTVIDAGGAV